MTNLIEQIAIKNNLKENKPIVDLNNNSFVIYCKAKDFKTNLIKIKEAL